MAWTHSLLCLLLIVTAGCAGAAEEPPTVEEEPAEARHRSIDWDLNITGPFAFSFVVGAPNGTADCRLRLDYLDGGGPKDAITLLIVHDQHPRPSWTAMGSTWHEAHAHAAGIDTRDHLEPIGKPYHFREDLKFPGMPDGARFTVAIQSLAGPASSVTADCTGGNVQDVHIGRTVRIFNAASTHNGASATAQPTPAGMIPVNAGAVSLLESVQLTVHEPVGRAFALGIDAVALKGIVRHPSGETPFEHMPDPAEGTRMKLVVDDRGGAYAVEWTQAALFGDDLVGAIVGLAPMVSLEALPEESHGHDCSHMLC